MGLRARKRFGQNFLADPGIVRRIVDAAGLSPTDPVLEIGPGRGAMTGTILERVDRAAAVELDRDLAALLRNHPAADRLELFEQDVLKLDFTEVQHRLGTKDPLVVLGNLPYNISKPITARLRVQRQSVDRAVLMFQREVAERLAAPPGTRTYGPLTILTGTWFQVRTLFHVSPGAFRPRPEVTSTVTGWETRADPPLPDELEGALEACLRGCFARRRQTLWNNLRAALGSDPARALLDTTGLEGSLRPEALPPAAYYKLAAGWPSTDAGR
ncbi:hypothetical protein ABI59_03655 [Acidobacteria bacterium Mor1]|nr:hypothetical protein ABI59_03655 [Acidobacteria bacterium Mor1]